MPPGVTSVALLMCGSTGRLRGGGVLELVEPRRAATREGVGIGVVSALAVRLRLGVIGRSGTLNSGSLAAIVVLDVSLDFVDVAFNAEVDFAFLTPFVFGFSGSAALFLELVLAGAVPLISELGSDALVERRRDILRTAFEDTSLSLWKREKKSKASARSATRRIDRNSGSHGKFEVLTCILDCMFEWSTSERT